MTSAQVSSNDDIAREGSRIASFFGVLLSNLGSFGILYFWTMGAAHLWTNAGGQINLFNLDGLPMILYWAFPFLVLVSLAAWFLYLARLDLMALALASSPIALAVLYYLWLVMIRSV